MGLDNGIVIRHKEKKEIDFPKDIPVLYDYTDDSYELIYWRKCWNLRDAIVSACELPRDGGQYNLSIDNLKTIWNIVNDHNKKSNWDESESIWTYKEIRDILDQDLTALEWLIYYKEQYPEAEISFYDSY